MQLLWQMRSRMDRLHGYLHAVYPCAHASVLHGTSRSRPQSTLIVVPIANTRGIAPRVTAGAASALNRTLPPPPVAAAVAVCSGSRRMVCVATVKTDGGSSTIVLARTHRPPPPPPSAPVDLRARPPLPLRPGRTKPHTHTRDEPHQPLLASRFQ
jgi:hypothetical protein